MKQLVVHCLWDFFFFYWSHFQKSSFEYITIICGLAKTLLQRRREGRREEKREGGRKRGREERTGRRNKTKHWTHFTQQILYFKISEWIYYLQQWIQSWVELKWLVKLPGRIIARSYYHAWLYTDEIAFTRPHSRQVSHGSVATGMSPWS